MKLKFLVSVGGVDFTYQQGEEYEVEPEEAKRFIEAGYAEEVNRKTTRQKSK